MLYDEKRNSLFYDWKYDFECFVRSFVLGFPLGLLTNCVLSLIFSIGIRGYTIGYDYYAPERSVCFHHYAVGKNKALRNKVKHFWENGNRYAG